LRNEPGESELLRKMMKNLQKRGSCPEHGRKTGDKEAKRA
jgi:hypothetical protein